MQIAILSARVGWHTDELCRALGERGHVGVVLSYENLVARLGRTRAALTNDGAEILEADAVSRESSLMARSNKSSTASTPSIGSAHVAFS